MFSYIGSRLCHSDHTDGESPPTVYKLVFGGVSGVLSQMSCYPIDIVRRRMQTSGDSNHYASLRHRNTMHTWRSVEIEYMFLCTKLRFVSFH